MHVCKVFKDKPLHLGRKILLEHGALEMFTAPLPPLPPLPPQQKIKQDDRAVRFDLAGVFQLLPDKFSVLM